MRDRDGQELVDAFIEQELGGAARFEGQTHSLETVVEGLGYRDLDEFLCDNPGAQDAIVEFIREWTDRCPEWKARLEERLEDVPDEEDAEVE